MKNLTSYDRQKAIYHRQLAREQYRLSPERKLFIALSLYLLLVVLVAHILGLKLM